MPDHVSDRVERQAMSSRAGVSTTEALALVSEYRRERDRRVDLEHELSQINERIDAMNEVLEDSDA